MLSKAVILSIALLIANDAEAWTLPSHNVVSKNDLGIRGGVRSIRCGTVQLPLQSTNNDGNSIESGDYDDELVQGRRQAMGKLATIAGLSLVTLTNKKEAANAYDKTYPVELDMSSALPAKPITKTPKVQVSPLQNSPTDLLTGSILWGSALWFLTGSRSNPLATPLANVLYNAEEEDWLQDRNDGLFAELPAPIMVLLGMVFCLIGFGVHLGAIYLAEGSVSISLQVAGTTLISAGALEIGRIASGEKKQTRDENDRDAMLEEEFETFATQRLKPGGNCHRSEVVAAFRRFNPKYRQADNLDYPLNDLEIEQLLRRWNEKNCGAQRSSAGFYSGLQINVDADIVIGSR